MVWNVSARGELGIRVVMLLDLVDGFCLSDLLLVARFGSLQRGLLQRAGGVSPYAQCVLNEPVME